MMSQPRRGEPERRARGSDRRPPQDVSLGLTKEDVERIFANDGYLAVNEFGERLGNRLADGGVSRSQVRNILNSFQNIAASWDATAPADRQRELGRQITRLKPNLVYLAGRETKQPARELLRELSNILGWGVDAVLAGNPPDAEKARRYTALVDLVEAMTAYHRAEARGE
jgi:CRISPR type III-A-associated protein Csm2